MKKLQLHFLHITMFISGAVVLILEILGTRLISPYFGTTIYVWTSLITVTLGALAAGYYVGGKLADKRPSPEILYNLIGLSGVMILMIPQIVPLVLRWSDMFGMKMGPLVSSLGIFFIPLALLGNVSPFIVKLLMKNVSRAGHVAGTIFSIGTLGSLTGGILAGFVLAPIFTAEAIILFAGMSLVTVFILWQLL